MKKHIKVINSSKNLQDMTANSGSSARAKLASSQAYSVGSDGTKKLIIREPGCGRVQ